MSTALSRLQVFFAAILLTSALWSMPRGVMGQAPIPTATRTPTPINVGNFVWDDLDQDGRQDAGEPGLAGIVVQLWNSDKTQLIDSAVTNASGNYSPDGADTGQTTACASCGRRPATSSRPRTMRPPETRWTATSTRPGPASVSPMFIRSAQT